MTNTSVGKRASIGFVWNQLSQILDFGLQFLATIVIARGLGATEYGIYATLLSFVSLVTLFSTFGFDQIINTYVPRMSDANDKARVGYLIKQLLLLRLLILAFASSLMLVFSKQMANLMHDPDLAEYLKLAIFYLIFSNLSLLLRHLLVAQFRMKEASLVQVGSSIVNLALSYILLKSGYGIRGLIGVLTLASFLSLLGYLVFSRGEVLSGPKPFNLSPLFRFGLTLWSIGFVNYALGKQSDILLMGLLLVGSKEIGFYLLAFGLTEKLSVLFTSGLAGVGLAAFSAAKAEHGLESLAHAWRAVMTVTTVLSFPVLLFFTAYAAPIILTLYSEEYLASVTLFQVFVSFHLLMRLTGGGANSTVMYVMNEEKRDFYLRLGGGAFNLVLALLLIPRYGALGAIVATGSSKLMVTVLEALSARQCAPLHYPFAFVVKVVTSSVIALGLSLLVPGRSIPSLVAAAVVYGGAIVALLYLLKPLEEKDKKLLLQVDERVYTLLKAF